MGFITDSKIYPYFLWTSQELENSFSLGKPKLEKENFFSEKMHYWNHVVNKFNTKIA